MKNYLFLLVTFITFTSSPIARAEDVQQIFNKVQEYITAKNYTKALTELDWAKKEIEKENVNRIKEFFPETISGFKGEGFVANSALGINALERNYNDDKRSTIKLSLSGGSGSAAEGAFAGLAAIGKMAAMMGQNTGTGDTIRVQGRTATLNSDTNNNSAELTVFLEGGSILKLEMDNSSNAETLKMVATEIKIGDLDNYLQGRSVDVHG